MFWRGMGMVVVLLVVAACGGSSGTDFAGPMTPNEVLEKAGHHRDHVEARWLLAEVEVRQAELAAALADKAKDPDHPSRASRYDSSVARKDLEEVRRLRRRCEQRVGSKPCSELGEIEAIVGEMAEQMVDQ